MLQAEEVPALAASSSTIRAKAVLLHAVGECRYGLPDYGFEVDLA